MKKYFVLVFILVFIVLFSGCEPTTTYTKDEVQAITNDIRAYLLDLNSQSYHISKELSDKKGENLILSEFMRVGQYPALECAYEIKGEDKHTQYFYKNGSLYTFDILLSEKQQEKKDITSLDFYKMISFELSNISKMLDEKYIIKSKGFSFVFDGEPSEKIVKYKFNAKKLYDDNILDEKYDEIRISANVDIETSEKFYLTAEFIVHKTRLKYLLESNMYVGDYERLKERLEFPNDLENVKR